VLLVAVRLNVDPAPVGVPKTVAEPLLAVSDNPAGSEPDVTAHVYPPLPSLASTPDQLNGQFIVAFGLFDSSMPTVPELTVVLTLAEAVLPRLSVAVTVNAYVPGVVALPEAPQNPLKDKPGGVVPVTAHVTGGIPPVITIGKWYAFAAKPGVKLSIFVLPTAIAGNTTSMSFWAGLAAEVLSVATTLKFQLPACVAVPAMDPVDAFKVRPGGSAPAVTAHVYPPAPPAAARLSGHEVFIRHPGAATVITTGADVARILNQISPLWAVEEKSGMVNVWMPGVPDVVKVDITAPVEGAIHSPAMFAAGTVIRAVALWTTVRFVVLRMYPARSDELPRAQPFSVCPLAPPVRVRDSTVAFGSSEPAKEENSAI
jgi:hypothetical protein